MPSARASPACCRIERSAVEPRSRPGLNVARHVRRHVSRLTSCSARIEPAARHRIAGGAGSARRRRSSSSRCRRTATREGVRARHPADRHVRGNLRHVRESRRPLAERAGRGHAGRRIAAGLEGAARARQSAEPAGLRLHAARTRSPTKCARLLDAAPAFTSKASARTLQSKLALGARRRRRVARRADLLRSTRWCVVRAALQSDA